MWLAGAICTYTYTTVRAHISWRLHNTMIRVHTCRKLTVQDIRLLIKITTETKATAIDNQNNTQFLIIIQWNFS